MGKQLNIKQIIQKNGTSPGEQEYCNNCEITFTHSATRTDCPMCGITFKNSKSSYLNAMCYECEFEDQTDKLDDLQDQYDDLERIYEELKEKTKNESNENE